MILAEKRLTLTAFSSHTEREAIEIGHLGAEVIAWKGAAGEGAAVFLGKEGTPIHIVSPFSRRMKYVLGEGGRGWISR